MNIILFWSTLDNIGSSANIWFFCTLCKKWEWNIRNPCAVKSQSGIIGRVAPFYSFGFNTSPLGATLYSSFFHFCVRLVYEPCKSGRNTVWLVARIACSEVKFYSSSS